MNIIKTTITIIIFRLKQLLSMYRVSFDYLDIIVGNTTDPTTMTYFTSLLKRAAPKGKIKTYN